MTGGRREESEGVVTGGRREESEGVATDGTAYGYVCQ